MIVRLSQKLATKIKAGPLREQPPDENPFADWSAHLFVADRTQYIFLSNTKSLYSTVMYAKGITNDSHFIERALSNIREFMEDDGQGFIFQRFIAPATGSVRFAKALNRSVTGSMNDLIRQAAYWLAADLAPCDLGPKLNDTPMSVLSYSHPREVFKKMGNGRGG